MCKSNHCHNCKTYAQNSKAREIALDGSNVYNGLYIKPMFDKGFALSYIQRNVELGGSLVLYTCIVYVMIPDKNMDKLHEKIVKYTFLGYGEGMKVYSVLCLETNKS